MCFVLLFFSERWASNPYPPVGLGTYKFQQFFVFPWTLWVLSSIPSQKKLPVDNSNRKMKILEVSDGDGWITIQMKLMPLKCIVKNRMGKKMVKMINFMLYVFWHNKKNYKLINRNYNVIQKFHVCVLSHFSCVRLFATQWTPACQAPLSMVFSRQECWSGLPCPSPGDLPDPGIKSTSPNSPALAGKFFTTNASWEVTQLFHL